MPRRPRIPAELKKGPFTLEDARAAGVSLDMLRRRSWRRLGSSLYCWTGLDEDPWRRLQAWQRRLPVAVFAGLSAAWLYRLDVDPLHPVEVTVPPDSGVRSRPGVIVHRALVQAELIRGLPATTLSRTFSDLRQRLTPVEVLVLADEALRRGLGRFDLLAEKAESPMETRLRWVLLSAGLPTPQVQTNLGLARADLYYPAAKLIIEYDGATHRDRLVEDNRRQNSLLNAGFRLLRYTALDVYQRPDMIVTQVRRSLQV